MIDYKTIITRATNAFDREVHLIKSNASNFCFDNCNVKDTLSLTMV